VVAFGQRSPGIRIKLATLAPRGSIWHSALEQMGQTWEKETDGLITFVVYPGGIAGDEAHIVRKMLIGQLNAAMLTTVGLSNIDSSVTALSHIPLLYESYEELDYIRSALRTEISANFAEKGFIILNWGDAGWVHFFTQLPMRIPDDLRCMKLFFWSNESGNPALWKKMGFHVVPLAATDILIALESGMINAFDTTPLAALANQWFAQVQYMADLQWAPLVGMTIIDKKIWDQIPTKYQHRLMVAAAESEKILKYESRILEQEAIDIMESKGLTINRLSLDELQEWKTLVQEVYPYIRGKIIPAVYFDRVIQLHEEYQLTIPSLKE
jgi:TRAP-type C4-dicarboxylate transport system substrate-binding protein